MIILDSNIVIDILKGNEKIIEKITDMGLDNLCITYITYMEVIYGARNKKEKDLIAEFLDSFEILYSNETIDKKAMHYVGEFALSHNANIPDSIIAAISIYYNYELMSHNIKDFKYIPGIKLNNGQ